MSLKSDVCLLIFTAFPELLIAITIVIFLFIIGIPSFIQAYNKAETQECLRNMWDVESVKNRIALDLSLPVGTVVTETTFDRYSTTAFTNFYCPKAMKCYTLTPIGRPPECCVHGSPNENR
jgi:hypothetical protein